MKTPAEKLSASKRKAARPANFNPIWRCEIAALRADLGLTLRDIETATGMSNATTSFVERGTDPQLSNARTLAKFFGKTIEEIWPEKIEREA